MRLADGNCLKTSGSVKLCVHLGKFVYEDVFFVLNENVPNILGMQFLRKC